jgi:hypothetical protein
MSFVSISEFDSDLVLIRTGFGMKEASGTCMCLSCPCAVNMATSG